MAAASGTTWGDKPLPAGVTLALIGVAHIQKWSHCLPRKGFGESRQYGLLLLESNDLNLLISRTHKNKLNCSELAKFYNAN